MRPSQPDVVFDAVGTLFDLAPVEQALAEQGAPPATLEAWFERAAPLRDRADARR